MSEEEIQAKEERLRDVLRVARELGDRELEDAANSALLQLRQSSVTRDRHVDYVWHQQIAARS